MIYNWEFKFSGNNRKGVVGFEKGPVVEWTLEATLLPLFLCRLRWHFGDIRAMARIKNPFKKHSGFNFDFYYNNDRDALKVEAQDRALYYRKSDRTGKWKKLTWEEWEYG